MPWARRGHLSHGGGGNIPCLPGTPTPPECPCLGGVCWHSPSLSSSKPAAEEATGQGPVPSSSWETGPSSKKTQPLGDATEPKPKASGCLLFPGLAGRAWFWVQALPSLLQMRRRLYKGVPPQVRGQVWALLLDIPKVKSTHQGLYEVSPCALSRGVAVGGALGRSQGHPVGRG